MNIRMVGLGPGLMILMLFFSSWTPVVKISTHEDNSEWPSRNPHMGIDAEGNTYVVWEGYTMEDSVVFWTKVDSEGNPGTVMKLSDGEHIAGSKDYLVDIAVDRQGNSYVTWTRSLNNDSDVYWVRIDSSGERSDILDISCHDEYVTNNNWNSQIGIDNEGNSYVVWQGFDGERDSNSNADIYWVKIDDKGEMGDMVKVSTHEDNILYGDIDPQIAVDRQGNSYVVWHGCDKVDCWKDPGDFEIYWARISAQGMLQPVKKVPPTDPDNVSTEAAKPQIAADGAGNSYIVWSGEDTYSYDVFWMKIDDKGEMGPISRISAYPGTDFGDYHPDFCVDESGTSYITWCGSGDNYGEIYWTKIDEKGNAGIVTRISDYLLSALYDDSDPRIAVDKEGNSYIVWLSFNVKSGKNFDEDILWVEVDTKGISGRVRNLSEYPTLNHFDRYCRIAVDDSGNSYVVWEGEDEFERDHIFFSANHKRHSSILFLIMIPSAIIAAILLILIIQRKRNQARMMKKT
jgi:hypothetical protein